MGIEDIQISEELETNAPSIKYRGNEGPKSPQEMEQMMMASLEEEYAKYVFEMEEQGIQPMSLRQFIDQAMAEGQMSKGPILPSPEDPVNPFGPKPQGPVLPNRQMAAYGGIMGLDGRKQYGIGSWFQENIMDPIKSNPAIAAAAAAIGGDYILNDRSYIGDFLGGDTVQNILKGKKIYEKEKGSNKSVDTGRREGGVYDALARNIVPIVGGLGAGIFTKSQQGAGGGQDASTFGQVNDQTAMNIKEYTKGLNLLDEKGMMAAGQNFALPDAARKYGPTEMLEVYQNAANGGRIGFDNGGSSSTFGFSPNDLLLLEKFKYDPKEVATHKDGGRDLINSLKTVGFAMGGRIGFKGGGADMGAPQMNKAQAVEEAIIKIMQKMQDPNLTDEDRIFLQEKLKAFAMPTEQMSLQEMMVPQMMEQPIMAKENSFDITAPNIDPKFIKRMPEGFDIDSKFIKPMPEGFETARANGGRIGFEEGGGIMDLGGMEKDYRAEGGFVPIGKQEKADDVPARLSVNEFVFTADAVRNAGGGDIDQGAQVMENMMKHLEQGGQVSEESQGMQGARDMFATSERLGEVI